MLRRNLRLLAPISEVSSARACCHSAIPSPIQSKAKRDTQNGPGLSHFVENSLRNRREKIFPAISDTHAYISSEQLNGNGKKVMLVTFGCQMNVNDTEVVRGILIQNGYVETKEEPEADCILIMTCSIRDGAEDKIWKRLKHLKRNQRKQRTVAVLGCMAERLKSSLLTTGDLCQVVAGPDSYRDLPRLLAMSSSGTKAMNVQGVKQITLLGQNVNSYRDTSESSFSFGEDSRMVEGFSTVYGQKSGGRSFATLLDHVSRVDEDIRIRFTSPHPKDFPTQVIDLIKERSNICNQIHLPAQSGDDRVLEAMGRGYTRETYLSLVQNIKTTIPHVSLTSDFIAGFCGETEEAHSNTLSLMRQVDYSFCFVFPYSKREGTRAHRRLVDDVPDEVKARRHTELAALLREIAKRRNLRRVGKRELVLIEGPSKKGVNSVSGRTDGGTVVHMENGEKTIQTGDYVVAQITGGTSQSMSGEYVTHSTLREYQHDFD